MDCVILSAGSEDAPGIQGRGIGSRLFEAARAWTATAAPGQPLPLWVIEANGAARRFYERLGGTIAERRMKELASGMEVTALRYAWPPSDPSPRRVQGAL